MDVIRTRVDAAGSFKVVQTHIDLAGSDACPGRPNRID
jgi:hypothetical protein